MKHLYKIIFLFVLIISVNNLNAKSNRSDLIIENDLEKGTKNSVADNLVLPSATITGSTTVCQNGTQPQITFTGSGGTAPYTFTYKIGAGSNISVISTGTGDTAIINVPTTTAGVFVYTLVSVTDSSGTQPQSGIATVIINPQPSADLNSSAQADVFNGFPVFKICSNQNTLIDFFNASTTTASNVNYTINWGDSTPDFTSTNTWTNTSHNYSVGIWTLLYTIKGQNGCNITKTYKVFIGNNPAVGLGNPGNTDICISSSLTFPITGTENNPPGTTYTVTFNDGSAPISLNHPPPPSVTHTFLKNSCGTTSIVGPATYQNSFYASIVAINPCDQSSASVVPIRISTSPVANFTLPQTVQCTNSQVCLTNTSIDGDSASSTSCSPPKIIWTISPNSGYTLASGTLGNDFGSTNTNSWTSGSSSICPVFTNSGVYSITMKGGNHCGTDQIIKTICIESPLSPQFTLNNNSGCTPQAITATNTTVTTNSCTPPTYVWNVTHTAAYCGTSTTTIPNQTTINASFNFVVPGTYAISLTATNSCGAVTSAIQTVIVKQPPTAIINAIADFCGPTSINPTAVVNGCAPASSVLSYAWSFPGGSPASSTAANPGTISYGASGTYTVSLTVTNECGVSATANEVFIINDVPTLTNTPLTETICSGSPTTLVNLTSNLTGATFSWTATATSGITGYTSSGTNTIPVQTLINSGATSGTVTYAVTPKLGICNGVTTNYVITVIPAPQITAQPLSSSVCKDGTPTTLTFTLSGVTGTPTYQWYSNSSVSNTGGTLITGETNATFLPPASTVGTFYYYCIISLPSGGCSSIKTNTATVVITPLVTITTQPTPTQNLCVGATISSPLMVTYSGGTGTVSYQWYSNTTNSVVGATQISGAVNASYTPAVFSVSGTTYYYVTVSSNGNGCGPVTSNLAEIVIFSDPTVSSQPLPTQTLCQGAIPQSLQVTATGGNGSFSYQWYQNMANNTTSGTAISGAVSDVYSPPTLAVGTLYYYCLITQSTLGCDVKSTIAAVIVNAAPTITNQPVSSTVCLGGTPTLLSVTYTNGVGTPTYQWYSNTTNLNSGGLPISGAINSTFSPANSTVGTTFYYCIITLPASGGCSSITSNTANVTINSLPVIDVQPTLTQSVCVGGTITNPLSVSYSGGAGTATYQWFSNSMNSNSGGTLILGATNASYTPPVFNTAGNFYYYCQVSLSGNGCGSVFNDASEISVVADPIVSNQPLVSQTLCQNGVPSDLIVSVTGGIGTYSYQWYSNGNNSNSGGVLIANATNAIYTPLTASVGTIYYYCVISQSGIGCGVVSATSAVIVNSAPTFTKQPKPSIICLGNVPNLLEVAFINGAGIPQYQWFSNTVNTISGGTVIGGATSASYNPPATNIGTLYYYCVVTLSSGGCSSITSDIAEVTMNPNPEINPQNAVICSGTAFTVTPDNLSGDIVPIGTTYTWTTPVISPSNSINGAVAQTIPQTAISQNLTNTTTSAATVTYTVTPVSGVCVGSNFTVTVTVNPSINANVTLINSTCFGSNNGSIQTNITGGIPFSNGQLYIISWTGSGGFTSTATSISNLSPGIYDLTIQDAGGCPFSKSYTVTEPQDILITKDMEKDITCFGAADGQISISVTGGTGVYSYSWTKDGTPFTALDKLTNLAPGNYQVTANDTNSCGPKTASFTITEPPVLDLTLINQTNVLCFGALTGAINVGVIGGTPSASGYTFAWTGPNSFTSTAQNLTNILAGTYKLTVTDASGCTDTLTVIITQPTEVIIDVTTTPIICYGGNNASINLSISGGIGPYQTVWNTLAIGTFQDNLSAGNYQITVTDANGCSKIVDVNIPEAPIFTINPVVKQISCFGMNDGSINLNLVGGVAPLTLVWSDGSTAGLTRNNLKPGNYTVSITDSKPCTISKTFIILEPQKLVLSANVTHAFDCDDANSGAINLLVAGGTPPFTYAWSNGATAEDLSAIPAGNYLVTVTDSRGCSKTAQFVINRQPPIVIGVETKTDFNCEAKSVKQTFMAQVSGGVPPYQLTWSSGTVSGTNNEMMNTNQNGTAILGVTDNLGCTANYTFNVAIPKLGNPSFTTSSYSYSTFGTFSIIDPIQFTNTATADYISTAWDFGDGSVSSEENPIHTFVKEGNYVVTQTVTYAFGCIYTYTVTLTIDKGYKLIVPNGFTPNGDGINETFKPVFAGLKSFQFDVYDTWGELIYSETGETLHGWDGRVKEKESENGNYYYKAKATTFYGTIINKNGPFTLIK
ncbi:PKD domain-containing protein [Flavobacterium gawalongense]|uniref:PKD domain-containing protein n=1 Tax=Flavobacterium gawalongense TaxID=2594432 RepID=A0A553BCR5_9FLAO|nr:PKD domain-containing protein [Flavobacterium gawalongense]TRW98556.1 PKD domain-containing protein [Flavobacterium gawalongense]TRX03077.1 PKD domain-containing protein [Flavobacterium gawalongense]TRX06041.1 PKD domain-containing protein [Flavobacterium gawalongense]TRX10969.1 PKD domain-containing protein [Flavobacterium gawalongense]TRX22611.1 PKD domain-containing protein [Flavobacterium gawalongense]